jgi:hypothetical protein
VRVVHGGSTVFILANTWISVDNVGSDSIRAVAVFSALGFEEFMRDTSVLEGEKNVPMTKAENDAAESKHSHAVITRSPRASSSKKGPVGKVGPLFVPLENCLLITESKPTGWEILSPSAIPRTFSYVIDWSRSVDDAPEVKQMKPDFTVRLDLTEDEIVLLIQLLNKHILDKQWCDVAQTPFESALITKMVKMREDSILKAKKAAAR